MDKITINSNMKRPDISVVIVAYNHAEYIGKAIQSVLDQTFGDFEIIVFDDGSRDNTKEIVSSFRDTRIKYHYQENSGLPASGRNSGMKLATGKYISLMDGDDLWYRKKLEKSRKILETVEDIHLVCHNEDILYKDKILRHTSYGPYQDDMYLRLLFKGNCLHTSAVTIRREVFFEDNVRFCEDKDLFAIEDYEYWLRLARKYKFYFLPDILGCYRVTEKGAFLSSNKSNSENMLRLLDRHFALLGHDDKKLQTMMKKRKSSVMCAAGRTCQHKKDFKECINWYIKAIKEYPFNYKAALGLIAALLRFKIVYK